MTHDQLTPEWIAGFFDGEGSVSLRVKPRGTVSAEICISQNDQTILYRIQDFLFKGNCSGTVRLKSTGGFDLRIRDKRGIQHFYDTIGPYVLLKHSALELALLAITTESRYWTNEEKERAFALASQLRQLNKED